MEVYDRHAQSLAGNVTSDRPAFTVGNLQSGLGFDISVYAYNVRGSSDPVQLHAYTLKSAEKRTGKTEMGRADPGGYLSARRRDDRGSGRRTSVTGHTVAFELNLKHHPRARKNTPVKKHTHT